MQEIIDIITKYGLRFHIFADDVQVYSPVTNGLSEISTLKECLNEINAWSKKNHLKLNEKKTKFIAIKTRNSRVQIGTLDILDENFSCDSFVKSLGILLDNNLNFKIQISDICKKGFAMIRQLWRLSSKVKSIKLKTQLVHSCVLPKIDYCNSLFLNLPSQDISKLQRLMNAAIRFIFNIRKRQTSITPYLKKCHILPVLLRIRFKVCVLVFKCVTGTAPEYLSSLINRKISHQSLRIAEDTTLLHEPPLDLQNYRNRRFEISGPRIWNSLPRSLREVNNLNMFKSRLKTVFFGMF